MLKRVLATFGVVALLTACGTPPAAEGPRDATDAIALAADRMRDAGSMSFTMDMEMSGEGFSGEMSGKGAIDMAARSMFMEMQISGLSGGTGDGRVEMRMIGDYVYMKLPSLAGAGIPSGKSWVRIDIAEMGGGFGDPFSSSDPTAWADYLRGISEDVETVGREDIRGHATTHYRAQVDLEKALQRLPDEQRERAATAIEELKGAGVGTMPMEVWIDDDGLIWRQSFEVDIGEQGRMTMSFDVLEYGVEVDVDEPPASEVFESDGFGSSMSGSSSLTGSP